MLILKELLLNSQRMNILYANADLLSTVFCQFVVWCPEPESNRHGRSRGILSPLCLPISPSGHFVLAPPLGVEPSSHGLTVRPHTPCVKGNSVLVPPPGLEPRRTDYESAIMTNLITEAFYLYYI